MNVKVELDLSNYVTIKKVNRATDIVTIKLTKVVDLAKIETSVESLQLLATFKSDLTKVSALVSYNVAAKSDYNTN